MLNVKACHCQVQYYVFQCSMPALATQELHYWVAGSARTLGVTGGATASTLTVNASVFVNNSGGAVVSTATENTITSCLFQGNSAEGDGAAVWIGEPSQSTVVTSSIFNANTGQSKPVCVDQHFQHHCKHLHCQLAG